MPCQIWLLQGFERIKGLSQIFGVDYMNPVSPTLQTNFLEIYIRAYHPHTHSQHNHIFRQTKERRRDEYKQKDI